MRKILIVLSFVILAACNSAKKGTSGSNAKYVLENIGNMSAQDIAQNYSDSNTEEGKDMFEEGTVERPFTILYPNTENEVIITWQEDARKNVHSINYSSNGNWISETGVKVGTTLEELNKMNGKPVSFYGFGWDYSGAVDWNGGKLDKSGVGVFLKTDQDIPNNFYGDKIIQGSPEEIEPLNLYVGSIMLMYGV